MPLSLTPLRILGRVLLLCLLFLPSACTLPVDGVPARVFTPAPGTEGAPRITAFLTLKESPSPAVRIEIGQIDVLADNLWLPLVRKPVALDSTLIGSGQVLLGAARLPPGSYRRLRLTISEAQVRDASGKWEPLSAEPLKMEIPLGEPLELAADGSRVLSFTWDVQALLADPVNPLAIFSVVSAFRGLPLDLLYVSCPDADTIFVVRADTNRVVDAFGLSGGPTWLALDNTGSTGRLYVLTPRERMIKAVDLANYRVVEIFPIPLNDVPTFMTVDAAGRMAYLLDEQSGFVSRMDLSSGQSMARVAIGYRPQYALYLRQHGLLAVSLGLSQKVLLLDQGSLAVRGSITTGTHPQGLAVAENQLYIAEKGDNTVSVFDLNSRAGQERIAVGFDPGRLLQAGNQIYVSHESEGMLTVLVPGQLGATEEIDGLGLPAELAYHPFYRRLYVADREHGAVSVVDTNANLLLGKIVLGALPFGLVMSQ